MINFISLDSFSQTYESIHGYLSLVICLLGIALNFFNIIVLTRKHMISSTNAILTTLAVSDFIAMFVYIPAAIKFYSIIESKNCGENSLFWTAYALFYVNVSVTMHSISIWLTILLAFFRYVYICHNELGKRLCTMKNTNISIIITTAICIFMCLPSYLLSKIIQVDCIDNSTNITINTYNIIQSDIDKISNGFVFRITFFIQAFCVKLIPCFLLIILSTLLVYSVRVANRNNNKLLELGRNKRENERSKEYNRTNIMLILVCFLFFITEFPQGVLAFLSIIFESKNFHEEVYMKLGDVMDLLAIINSATNFILYCLMSNVFRNTFKMIFCRIFCFKPSNLQNRNFYRNSSLATNFSTRMQHKVRNNAFEENFKINESSEIKKLNIVRF